MTHQGKIHFKNITNRGKTKMPSGKYTDISGHIKREVNPVVVMKLAI